MLVGIRHFLQNYTREVSENKHFVDESTNASYALDNALHLPVPQDF